MREERAENQIKKQKPVAKKFAIDVSWVFISMIISLGVGIVLKIVLGNYFGPKGLGLFSMVLVIQGILNLVGGFGIPPSIVKFVAEYKDNEKKLSAVISCGLINTFLIGWALTFIILVLSGPLADLFGMPDLAPLLWIVAFIFPFYLVNDVFVAVYNGFREMKKFTFITIFRRGGLLILTLIFVLFGWGVAGAVFALVLIAIFTTILNLILFSVKPIKLQFKNHVEESKKLFKFSTHLLLANSIGYLNTHLDMVLVGYFLTDEHVGIYAVAVMFARLFIMIPEAIQRISYPMTSEYFAKKQILKIERLINVLMRYTFVIVTVLGLFLIFFGEFIIQLIYPGYSEFLDSYLPMVILIIGFSLYSISISIGGTFVAVGKPDISLKIRSIAVVGNIILNLSLIPLFGLLGAAFATIISINLSMTLMFTLIVRKIELKLKLRWMILGVALFLLTIIFYFILKSYFNQYIIVIILFAAYVMLIFIGKIITQKDTMYIRKIIFG